MARYHVSRLGRLSSPDPIAGSTTDPQSMNRYSYSINDPANITDPSGASGCDTVEAKPRDKSQQASGDGPSDSGAGTADSDANPPQQAGCGGADTPFGGDSGDDEIGIDGAGFGPSSLMGATGEAIGGITITGPPNPQKQIPSPGSTLLWGLKLVSTTIGWCGDPEAQQLCLIGNFAAEPFVWNAQPQSSQSPQGNPGNKSPQEPTQQQQYQQCMSSFNNSTEGQVTSFFSLLNLYNNWEEWLAGGGGKLVGAKALNAETSEAVEDYSITAGSTATTTTGFETAVGGGTKALGVAGTVTVVAATGLDAQARLSCQVGGGAAAAQLIPVFP